ncbi:unnamed protein product, partial [Discosporangium mesarthrocarpum]
MARIFLDPLISPLCQLTSLNLGGIITAPGPGRERGSPLGPADFTGICEAVCGCTSLQVLDMSGSDLSGTDGARAAGTAISSLIAACEGGAW